MFVAELAQARGAENHEPAAFRAQPEPARRQHAQEMAARKQQYVGVESPHAGNDAIGPSADLREGFAAGTAVAQDAPAGNFLANVDGPPPLVGAVVPLDQIVIDLRDVAEAPRVAEDW